MKPSERIRMIRVIEKMERNDECAKNLKLENVSIWNVHKKKYRRRNK